MALSQAPAAHPYPTQYEYDPWLLDDHPLRSYPTECIPGLLPFLGEWGQSLRKRWKASLLRAGCLLLACFAVVHFLRALPFAADHVLPSESLISHLNPRNPLAACTFPASDVRPNALSLSSAGCRGARDVGLQDGELQPGTGSESEKAR
ncbi:hypothetical protein NUU61_010122 [Penicillium alfredii]|uniref:Uncharacterized protein n=1 Tax=Penicillium alfredii TaxID=1506179 RepID=A0A9W9EHF3_9EURO|nr:uncharacterized protein NUU61_010122 [Penicillium alfredii]KAJ5081858.1 hypothetical protein NUU61_010122 [Penicillium alfredii]